MSNLLTESIYGVPWAVLAAAAALIAVAYAVLPGGLGAEGLRWFVLRWFHTIAWAFFALAALARSKVAGTPIELAAPLAATGGLVYVALMLTTLAGEG